MAKQNKQTVRRFRDTVREMADKDPEFKKGLMAEAIDELLSGDPAVGRTIIKNYFQGYKDLQEGFALMEILAKSKKNQEEGKVKSLENVMLDNKRKAVRSWHINLLKDGRITIPAALRRAYDINPGDEFEFVERADGLIIIPTKNRPKFYGKLHKLATKVFEDSVSATLWLNESQFALDGAIPVRHMKTRKGAKEVEDLLVRIEYEVLM